MTTNVGSAQSETTVIHFQNHIEFQRKNKKNFNQQQKNICSTVKNIWKGLGMPYIPGEQSIAAVNVDRVRREGRSALGKVAHDGGQFEGYNRRF